MSRAVRRALRERRARIDFTPAIRVHVTTDDGYEAHYATTPEQDDGAPCDSYILTSGLDECPLTCEVADDILSAFPAQVREALDGSAAEAERLSKLTHDLAGSG